MVQLAATLGRAFPYELLRAVSPLDEAMLQQALAGLVEAELLYQRGVLPQATYLFKHALIQETAYQSLLKSTRRQYHRYIAQVLEAQFPDTAETQPELLAYHYTEAECREQAVGYWQQAGARAHDRAAFREAVASFEQALQALAHLPVTGDTRVLAIDIRLALGFALTHLGEHGRHLVLLGEAEALARALNDQARLGWVLSSMALALRITGDPKGAIAPSQQALDLAVALGDRVLQAEASLILGIAYDGIGDFGRAAELLRRHVEAADRQSGPPSTAEGRALLEEASNVRLQSQAALARTLGTLGVFAEGRRHGEEALRLATREGRGITPLVVHAFLSDLYLVQGDLEHTILVCDQGLALSRASGNRNMLPMIVADLGYAYTLQGRLAEGRALLEEAISESISTGARRAVRWAWLSESCRLQGHGAEALQHARQALDLARQQKDRGEEALALHQLGVVHAHAAPSDVMQAEACYQQALTLAKELGMRPLQAHCHHGLGRLYHQTGRAEPARTALSTAIALYRAMDMTFWLPQAAAALAQVEGITSAPGEGIS